MGERTDKRPETADCGGEPRAPIARLGHFQGYRTLPLVARAAAACWPRRLELAASIYSNDEMLQVE